MIGKFKINTINDEILEQLSNLGIEVLWVEEEEGVSKVVIRGVEIVPEIDWEKEWREHSPYFKEGFVEWEGMKLIPGPGFGDISHETTFMMLNMMKDEVKGKVVWDIGCGSGVLAIKAALNGAKEVYATDIDPDSLSHAASNAALNNVNIKFEAPKKADLILINMIVSEQKEALGGIEVMGGVKANEIISSGCLVEEKKEYLKFIGLEPVYEEEKGIWVGFKFRRGGKEKGGRE